MANHFNELLLQILKQINVRLDRLDGRMDRLIETKADQTVLDATNEKLDALSEKLDTKADKADLDALGEKVDALSAKLDTKADKADLDALGEKVDGLGVRIDRIEGGIGTLKWFIGAEVAVIGVILAFIKGC